MLNSVYRSAPIVICYDNEPPSDPPPSDPPPSDPPNDGPDGDRVMTLTQSQLNTMMAEHKRGLQSELQKTKSSLEQTESQLQELLENKELNDSQIAPLQEALENVRKQLRTKEQQAVIDKQKLEQEWKQRFEEADKRAQQATSALDNHIMERSLIDAVGSDAYNLQVYLDVMKPRTKRVEGEVMVDLPDVDAEGKPTTSQFTPAEAVKRMKELPMMYGGLFKSNLVNGIGGTNSTGGITPGGKIPDITKVDYSEFKRIIKENPKAYG